MTSFISVGDTTTASKTLSESDISMFAAISGDFDPIHMDEHHARQTMFGGRIAHGILSMALLSTVAAKMSALARERGFDGTSVSLGFDRIRFVKPVKIGDTLTASYTVQELLPSEARSISKVAVENQDGEACVVGQHIMKWMHSAE